MNHILHLFYNTLKNKIISKQSTKDTHNTKCKKHNSLYETIIFDVERAFTKEYTEKQEASMRSILCETICDWLSNKQLYMRVPPPNTDNSDISEYLAPIIPIGYPKPSDRIIDSLNTLYTGKKEPSDINLRKYEWVFETIIDRINLDLIIYDETLLSTFVEKYKKTNYSIDQKELYNTIIEAFNEVFYMKTEEIALHCIKSFNLTVEEFCDLDVRLANFFQNCEYRVEVETTSAELKSKILKIPHNKTINMRSTYSIATFNANENTIVDEKVSFNTDDNTILVKHETDTTPDIFLHHLMLMLCDHGAIIIREFLNEKYETINKDGNKVFIPYQNIYGCSGIDGQYTWLTSEALNDVCDKANEQLSLPPDICVNYCYYPDVIN